MQLVSKGLSSAKILTNKSLGNKAEEGKGLSWHLGKDTQQLLHRCRETTLSPAEIHSFVCFQFFENFLQCVLITTTPSHLNFSQIPLLPIHPTFSVSVSVCVCVCAHVHVHACVCVHQVQSVPHIIVLDMWPLLKHNQMISILILEELSLP